jgi:hypothetical protein
MFTTTASQTRATVIEEKTARMDTRRFSVYIGGQFAGKVLRDKAAMMWVAYRATPAAHVEIGRDRDREKAVKLIVGDVPLKFTR